MKTEDAPRTIRLPRGRTVGYRRIGSGPPVALLHASPRSASASLPLAHHLAAKHTVFAFDNPGFGWSDALPIPRPDAADLGDALIESFNALGIIRAPIYGSHTGAAIAVAAGQRHPDRVTALALDGYAVFTPTQQAESVASYLAKIEPSWDGTHLGFLWSRVKDQFTVFPWYLMAQSARLPRPLAPLSLLQAVVVDFLAAGNRYRAGYAAAFRYDGVPELRRLTIPTAVMARSDDLLFHHLDAVVDVPACVSVQRLGEDMNAWAEAMATALVQGGSGAMADAPPQSDTGLQVTFLADGAFGITHHPGPAARPIVLLPGIPGSAAGEASLARTLSRARPVYAVDLPGFGASTWSGAMDVAGIANGIQAALAARDVADFDVVGLGESDAIAAALSAHRLVLVEPIPQGGRAMAIAAMSDITPRGDGAHLFAAWHQLRDTQLWRPWFTRDPAHAIDIGTDPDVPRLHAIMTDWMRGGTAGHATLAASMGAPFPSARASILARPGHPWTAELPPSSPWPNQRDHRGDAILRALDQPA